MSKGTPFTEQDLLARGFRADDSGIFHFVAKPGTVEKAGAMRIITPPSIEVTHIKIPKPRPTGLVAIENVLRASGIQFVNEYRFSDKKKYLFDVAVPSMMLAIEYEGIFSNQNGQNGHTGVTHYIKDCNKYNLATVEGWKVLRYTAKNYKNFLDDLKQLLTK